MRNGQRVAAEQNVVPRMRPGYRICRKISQLLYIFLFQGRAFGVEHVPRSGGVLLASNHQSYLDPVIATLALPREGTYMARDSLFEHPTLRRVIEYFHAFPVKRGQADMRAIKEMIRRLRGGELVLAFPEATRTADGSIGPMRSGIVLVARKVRVPIVPTLILGAFEAWPRTQKLPHPSPLLAAYDEPIYPHEHPEWSDEQCVSTLRDRILTLQRQYRSHSSLRAR